MSSLRFRRHTAFPGRAHRREGLSRQVVRVWVCLCALAVAPAARAHLIGEAAHDREAARFAREFGALYPFAEPAQPAGGGTAPVTGAAAMFSRFSPKVRVRSDGEFVHVESDSMPDHRMMVGITAWQQQVPLPQRYSGNNAWRIPLRPVPARNPLSAKSHFFKGAIALAANGVPIFNPIKTNGRTDTFLAGELDEFGGHCGRADDYHYHIAPLHLQEVLGAGSPLAYALDGYPIHGLTEPDGSEPQGLDAFNGHQSPALGYHYHASRKYPYVNGGFHGEVVERDGQVDPQPRTNGVRPDLPPLPGARITGFTRTAGNDFSVRYEVRGEQRAVNYSLRDDGSVKFDFVDGRGAVTTEVHSGRSRGGGGDRRPREAGGDAGRKGRPEGQREVARRTDGASEPAASAARPFSAPRSGRLVLTSPAFADGDPLPDEFNGNGEGATPPLAWSGAPAGTGSFALIMDHIDRDGILKTYWVLHDLPAATTGLPKNARGIGRNGATWKRDQAYVPPHSSGGAKQTYTIHLYALSSAPEGGDARGPLTREQLLAAIEGRVLDSAELRVTYQRPPGDTRGGADPRSKKGRPKDG